MFMEQSLNTTSSVLREEAVARNSHQEQRMLGHFDDDGMFIFHYRLELKSSNASHAAEGHETDHWPAWETHAHFRQGGLSFKDADALLIRPQHSNSLSRNRRSIIDCSRVDLLACGPCADRVSG